MKWTNEDINLFCLTTSFVGLTLSYAIWVARMMI
jgi:hypothetical protein